MDVAADLIHQYGYAALFGLLVLGIVGLPIPDEAVLTLVGYLCFTGHLYPAPAVLTAFLGTACGITISYGVGRLIGLRALDRLGAALHLSEAHIRQAQGWMSRWGPYALPVAYFVPGVRHVVALLAGTACIPATRFAAFAYAGALVWSSGFISVGYLLGTEWHRHAGAIHRGAVLLSIAILAGAGALCLGIRVLRRRHGS